MKRISILWLCMGVALAAALGWAPIALGQGSVSIGVSTGGCPSHGAWNRPCWQHMYPKYYGGFHYRYFQETGFPPGDIGLRGNGVYMTPW